MQNIPLWSDYITWSPGAKRRQNFWEKLTHPDLNGPQIRVCEKPLLIRKLKKDVSDFFEHIQSQRTLWSSCASDFSKKKAYDDNTLPITHTLF